MESRFCVTLAVQGLGLCSVPGQQEMSPDYIA